MRVRTPSAWKWFQALQTGRPLDPAAEAAFFGSIRVSNGAFKTTSAGRLDDLNRIILISIRGCDLRNSDSLDLVDVGVSSGVSTLEWADSLESAGVRYRLLATDLLLDANLFRYAPWFHALVDHRGAVLQYQVCGAAFRGWHSRGDLLRMKFLPIRTAELAHRLMQRIGSTSSATIPLVIGGLTNHPSVDLSCEDLFVDDRRDHARFDVVRAANVLNRSYFDDATLQLGARNLARRLRPGGILAICRTERNSANHGSLYRLTDGRLQKFAQLGEGSEMDDICARIPRSEMDEPSAEEMLSAADRCAMAAENR